MKEKATIYDLNRMCKYFNGNCISCPLYGKICVFRFDTYSKKYIDNSNEIILNWCKEHPVKTRQDKFLEMFPNANLLNNEMLAFCPKDIDKTLKLDCCCSCLDCRKSYWLAEVEENV